MIEVPPYQALDLILGRHKKVTVPPVAGWVVTAPDSRIPAAMFIDEVDASTHVEETKRVSKWPEQVFARKCWIHSEEGHAGEVAKRRHWTPR